MINIGDKYIIEIGDKYKPEQYAGRTLYKIKGFTSLVFDEYGLSKLKKLDESKESVTTESFSIGDVVRVKKPWSAALSIGANISYLGVVVATGNGNLLTVIRDDNGQAELIPKMYCKIVGFARGVSAALKEWSYYSEDMVTEYD